jgi:deoxyribose-phosphate aldolase
MNIKQIAKMIDHALLNPSLTTQQLEEGIVMARQYEVASVCILPFYLKRCAEVLQNSSVKASTTIGFPHGAQSTIAKMHEATLALENGGQELDMVVNISQVLSGNWDFVISDIKAVIEITHARDQKVKVIFENCYLNDDQKIRLCEICSELKADWVKTSTGFGLSGATIEDVRLMRRYSDPSVHIKAAGGIKTLEKIIAFYKAGATRIGCSGTEEILKKISAD